MEVNAQYSEFISHLLIRVIENKTGKRYELTLFGVVLILSIVYYDRHNPSKIFFNDYLDQQRNNYYYNRVVSNYKDKIPLIFAKWQILTDVFNGVDFFMPNFELVFYKEIRTPLISLPMNMGGVKEIYENMRGIAYHGYSKLTDIYKSGVSVLETSTEVDARYYMEFIKDKLSNIELLLQTTDLQRFMGYIAKQNYSSIYQTGIVTAIENSFANEVSFLFYISLTTKANFPPQFRDEHIMPSRLYDFMVHGTERSNVIKPRDLLLEILERDIEIQARFLLWMKDLISYEKQIIDHMLDLQSEVGLFLDN